MLVLVLTDVGLYCWGQGKDPALVPLELLVEGEWPRGSLALCFPLPMGILTWIFSGLIFRWVH